MLTGCSIVVNKISKVVVLFVVGLDDYSGGEQAVKESIF